MTEPGEPGIPGELVTQTSTFVEPAATFGRIAEWLSQGAQFLVLAAELGFGKTSIAVRLVQISLGSAPPPRGFEQGWLHAWHFCRARRYESLDPRAVLEQLATQLCRTVPGYAEEIARSVGNTNITITQTISGDIRDSTVTGIGRLALPATDPRKLLHDYFRVPLRRLGRDVTVLVDAINESDEQGDPRTSLAWLLATIQDDPVPQLRLVLTTRNGTTARRFSSGHLNLRDIQDAGTDAVRVYALRRFQDAGVREAAPLAARISDAANGNFQYAVHAVGQYLSEPTDSALTLPDGLAELYSQSLSRLVAADIGRWHSSIRPVLALLVQSRGEGFTRRQLSAISGLPPSAIDEALELCSPYLLGELEGPFVPHHEALRESLRTSPQPGIHSLEATQRIIKYLSREVTDPHAVTHLLGYLRDYHQLAEYEDTTADARKVIENTLTDAVYLNARLAETGVDSFLSEISTLRRIIDRSDVLDTIHGVFTRQAHNLRRWDPDREPSMALQQVQYDCAYTGAPDLVPLGGDEEGPTLYVEWSARSEGTWLLSHTFDSVKGFYGAMVLSRDSNTIAFAYSSYPNNLICVHEVETGAIIHSLSHDWHVFKMRFSEDNQKLLVCGYPGQVVAWNLTTGKIEPTTPENISLIQEDAPPSLPAYIDAVTGTGPKPIPAITPDGRYAVALCRQSGRQFVGVWDLRNREIIGVHFDNSVRSLAITADGKKVIVGGAGGCYMISPPPRTCHTYCNGHHAAVEAVALREHRAVSIGNDGTLKVRDSSSGRPELIVKTQPYVITSIDITPDDKHCIAGSYGGDVNVFDLDLQLAVRKLATAGVPVDDLWKSRNGARETVLPPMGFDEPYPHDRPIRFYNGRESGVSAVDISSDGHLAVTGTVDGVLRTWDLGTGNLIREFTRDGCFIPAARFTPDGRHIVTVSQMSGVFIPRLVSVDMWSIASGNRVDLLWPHPEEPPYEIICGESTAVTRDGRYLATTSIGGTLIVQDLVAGREIGRLTLHARLIHLAIDDTRVLVGTDQGEVSLIRFRGGG